MIRKVIAFMQKQVRRQSAEEGSALIELGMSLPVLFIMILGAGELARIAYAAIEVSNAAHAAAQYAASSHASAQNFSVSGSTITGGISNAVTADSDLSGSNAISVKSVSLSCACANTASVPSSCSDNSTCESNHTAMIETVTVQTQTTFTPLIHLPGTSTSPYTLTGTASQTVTNQ